MSIKSGLKSDEVLTLRLLSVLGVLTLLLTSGCATIVSGPSAASADPPTAYDPAKAADYGHLIQFPYDLRQTAPTNTNPSAPENFPADFKWIMNLQARDAGPNSPLELYGVVAQNLRQPGEFIVAIRGTEDLEEWIDDARFKRVEARKLPGKVETGFHGIFETFVFSRPGSSELYQPVEALTQLRPQSLVIVGHSLGASLATLLATRFALEESLPKPRLYTLASPRVGNGKYAKQASQVFAGHYRVVNSVDVVPKVPLAIMGYRHVNGLYQFNSHDYANVEHSIVCYHNLFTYLSALDPARFSPADKCLKAE